MLSNKKSVGQIMFYEARKKKTEKMRDHILRFWNRDFWVRFSEISKNYVTEYILH